MGVACHSPMIPRVNSTTPSRIINMYTCAMSASAPSAVIYAPVSSGSIGEKPFTGIRKLNTTIRTGPIINDHFARDATSRGLSLP